MLSGLGLILTHVLNKGSVHRADLGVDVWFSHHRSAGWNSVMLFGTDLARTQTVIAVAVVAALLLRWWLKRWHKSFILVAAIVGEVLIFLAVTETIPQRRPCQTPSRAGDIQLSVRAHGRLDRPVRLPGLLLLAYLSRPWLRWLAALLFCIPVFVALSRLYEGEHYPSDVIAGAMLGVLWLTCVFRTLPPLRVAPGGARARPETHPARQ